MTLTLKARQDQANKDHEHKDQEHEEPNEKNDIAAHATRIACLEAQVSRLTESVKALKLLPDV